MQESPKTANRKPKTLRICVPIVEPTVQRARRLYLRAARKHLWAEVRLDYLEKPDLKRLSRTLPGPVIATNRHPEEGGRWQGTEDERCRLLEEVRDMGVPYLDLEFICDPLWRESMWLLKPLDTRFILSWHDMAETPDSLFLEDTLEFMLEDRWSDIIVVAERRAVPESAAGVQAAGESPQYLDLPRDRRTARPRRLRGDRPAVTASRPSRLGAHCVAVADWLTQQCDANGLWYRREGTGDPNVNRFTLGPLLGAVHMLQTLPAGREAWPRWKDKLDRALDHQRRAFRGEFNWEWVHPEVKYPNQDLYGPLCFWLSAELYGRDEDVHHYTYQNRSDLYDPEFQRLHQDAKEEFQQHYQELDKIQALRSLC